MTEKNASGKAQFSQRNNSNALRLVDVYVNRRDPESVAALLRVIGADPRTIRKHVARAERTKAEQEQ